MHHNINNFNLRVYGLLIQDNKVLVTDENRSGYKMTKFPGGGLEFGEGLADCLKREFQEELEIDIDVTEILYTNDFLQISSFNKKDQLHSFYFLVSTKTDLSIYLEEGLLDIPENSQGFRWVRLDKIEPNEFTFPIDRVVAGKLKQ